MNKLLINITIYDLNLRDKNCMLNRIPIIPPIPSGFRVPSSGNLNDIVFVYESVKLTLCQLKHKY